MATRQSLFDSSIQGNPNFFTLGTPRANIQGPTRTSAAQRFEQRSTASAKETKKDSLFRQRTEDVIGGAADIGLELLRLKQVQGNLESQAEQLEENARIARLNADRTRVASDRIRTSMLETANNVMASNLVAAFASGLRNSGSAARANESVRSQLDINRFIVFSDQEINARELERQAARFEALAREKREQAEGSTFGTVLGIVGTIAGVAAAFYTGGASLALTGVSAGANVGRGFV